MEKLLESFKTLVYLGTQVSFFIEVHNTYTQNEEFLNQIEFQGHYSNLPFAKSISGTFLNYALIISNSFFDEYNKEFTSSKHPDFKVRIDKLKAITKPVMRRVNKWTNFKDYRNYILAHNFRIKDVSIFSKDFKPFHFNSPHTNTEIILLNQLMRIITTCISKEFPELVEQINWKENALSKMTFNYNEVDIDKELTEIWTQIETVKKQL